MENARASRIFRCELLCFFFNSLCSVFASGEKENVFSKTRCEEAVPNSCLLFFAPTLFSLPTLEPPSPHPLIRSSGWKERHGSSGDNRSAVAVVIGNRSAFETRAAAKGEDTRIGDGPVKEERRRGQKTCFRGEIRKRQLGREKEQEF